MNTENEITQTELLGKINSLKIRHEILKKEICDMYVTLEVKEKELISVENEYVKLIGQIAS